MAKTIKAGVLYRQCELDRAAADEKGRTIPLSFSSELPAERWFGVEILDHSPKSVRQDRLKSGMAPLLVNHNPDDIIGVIEKAEISPDKRGRAIVRFGNSARAQEIWADVKDGIRGSVSVGYRIYEATTEKVDANGVETYRVTDWEPLEISLVSVPVDHTVGVGRSETQTANEVILKDSMNRSIKYDALASDGGHASPPAPAPSRVEIEREVRKSEQERIREINAYGKRLSGKYQGVEQLVGRAIDEGMPIDHFRNEVLKLMENPNPLQTSDGKEKPKTLGMDERDMKQWSLLRAMKSAHDGEKSFEIEISEAWAKKAGQATRSFWIPPDLLQSRNWMQRDLTVGVGSLGGNTVATELHAERFIDLLRNRMLVARMGATFLTGLNGNFIIPRQSGATTAYWTTETQATTESNLTVDQVTLTPKAVTALQDYSKMLLLQSSLDVENLVRNDLVTVLSLAVDLAALHGPGTGGEPTGVASTSGIGSVAGGTNGAAPTWGNIVSLETEVSQDNADIGAVGYLTNAKVRGKLKQTLKGSSTATDGIYIWPDVRDADGFGMLNGYKTGVTNQVRSNLTKGTSTTVCSAIFFGNWADLLIGQWSGVDILIDPYTAAGNRLFKMYADIYVDVAVRHPESFSAMLDALTT